MDNLILLEFQLKELLDSDKPRDTEYHSLRKKIHYLRHKDYILKKSKRYIKRNRKLHRKHCNNYALNHASILKIKNFINGVKIEKPYSDNVMSNFINWFKTELGSIVDCDIQTLIANPKDGEYVIDITSKSYIVTIKNKKFLKFKQNIKKNLFNE